jgi:hypothetical protein
VIWMDGQRHLVCRECNEVARIECGQLYAMPGQPERWCCLECIAEVEEIQEAAASEQHGPLWEVEAWA